MNATHLHLLLNHIPVFGVFFAVFLLAVGYWLKSQAFKTTAMFVTVVASLLTFAVMQTGEAAEDAVEKIAGVTEAAIHDHEEAAEFAQITMYLAGAVAAAGLVFRKREKIYNMAAMGLLVVGLFGFAVVARTNYLGGYIRHAQEFGTTPQPGGVEQDDD